MSVLVVKTSGMVQKLLQQQESCVLLAVETLLGRLYVDYTSLHAVYTQAAHAQLQGQPYDMLNPLLSVPAVEVLRLTMFNE